MMGSTRGPQDVVTDLRSTELPDEALLAEAVREGSDGPAFVTLVDRHRERVWRICYRLLGNEHDAHDAAQDVFVRLFFNRAKFSGRSKFATWLHSLTVRTCLTLRRGRGRRERRETQAGEETLSNAGAKSETAEVSLDLMKMLECLDEEDRAMLILKYAEGYEYEELAGMFELSVSACKMRLSRAREKLQAAYPDQAL